MHKVRIINAADCDDDEVQATKLQLGQFCCEAVMFMWFSPPRAKPQKKKNQLWLALAL